MAWIRCALGNDVCCYFFSTSIPRIHQTGGQPSHSTAREFFSQLNKEAVKIKYKTLLQSGIIAQVKSLYDKYEVDMEMWDYRIEPYLSYAGEKMAHIHLK